MGIAPGKEGRTPRRLVSRPFNPKPAACRSIWWNLNSVQVKLGGCSRVAGKPVKPAGPVAPLYYWIPPGNLAHCPPTYRQSSSVVEQRTHKPLVAGSIPASGTTLKRVSHQPVLGALAGPVPVCQKSRRLHRSLRMTAALETLSLSPLGAGYC